MNWRQSAKAAEKVIRGLEEQIADLMHYKKMATADIKDYNKCILSLISGNSACVWCEDREECQLEAKTQGKGCQEWLLAFRNQPNISAQPEQETDPIAIDGIGGADESERVFQTGPKG